MWHIAVKYAYRLEGRRPLGRNCCGERGKLKWIIKEARWEVVYWYILAQNRLYWRPFVKTVRKYVFHIML